MSSFTNKKQSKRVSVASVFITATFNNTIITYCDLAGNALCWSSAGKCGFRGSRRGTPYAASVCAEDVTKRAIDLFNVKTVSIIINGPGSGRESSVRSISSFNLKITSLKDVTSIPHNGCRSPKKRRV